MPRGEHFKKENPRINQVSFKVSDSELVQLKKIAKQVNMSIAEWLRGQITNLQSVQIDSADVVDLKNKEEKAETPKIITPKVEVKKVEKN